MAHTDKPSGQAKTSSLSDEPFSIVDRTVIVTGAGRGNGQAIARGLVRLGAKVVGLDRSFEGPADCGYEMLTCNITQESDVREHFDRIIGGSGGIDGLINNAGISLSAEDCYSRENFERTIAVNTLTPLRLSWMAAEAMKGQGRGSIVNITSLGAHLGFPLNPSYQASKAALRQITKAMAIDYGRYGIRVNNVCPGYMVTDMTMTSYDDPEKRQSRLERMVLQRWGQPDDLVGPCAFLLSDAACYITGIDLPVDGGWLCKGL